MDKWEALRNFDNGLAVMTRRPGSGLPQNCRSGGMFLFKSCSRKEKR